MRRSVNAAVKCVCVCVCVVSILNNVTADNINLQYNNQFKTDVHLLTLSDHCTVREFAYLVWLWVCYFQLTTFINKGKIRIFNFLLLLRYLSKVNFSRSLHSNPQKLLSSAVSWDANFRRPEPTAPLLVTKWTLNNAILQPLRWAVDEKSFSLSTWLWKY